MPTFDASPGATNTLDLVVEGATALFGVNGAFVARVDLPPPVSSDVYIGVGFFEGHKVEGRKIPYRGFQVWR